MKNSAIVLFLLCCLTAHLGAQTAPRKFELQASSPQFWRLLDRNAQLAKVAGGFGFTEGPVWDPAGFLYVSDETLNKIFRVYLDGRKESFILLGDPDGNTFDETPEQCHQLRLRGPIIDNRDVAKIRTIREGVFEPATLSTLYPVADGPAGLEKAVDELCQRAAAAVRDGASILILSDRGMCAERAPIPSLLAVASVHGLVASPFKAGYVAAKHGVLGLVKVLALEGAEAGISASALCPAYVRTALVERQLEDRPLDDLLAPQAVKRLLEPSEVAAAAAWLLGPDARSVTGAPLVLDLGWTAR